MKEKPEDRRRNGGEGSPPEDAGRGASQEGPFQGLQQGRRSAIAIDQPFDYEEVIRVTGPRYVQHLHHDGVVFAPYEFLRRHPPVPPSARQECIWMKAGIINFRMCDNDCDCDHCEFDMHMRRAMGEQVRPGKGGAANGWPDQMRTRFETLSGPCIYASLGRAGVPRRCPENYECFRCPVHHEHAARGRHEPFVEPRYTPASGYRLAGDYHYHAGHAWAHTERSGQARIGMDDFAARVFGRPEALRLPSPGDSVRQGEVGFVIFRNGRQAPVQSPLTGRVVAVNAKAVEDPSLCHQDAYFKGWLLLIEPSFLGNELKALYYGQDSLAWMENENRLLLESLGAEYERLAATGGEAAEDLFGSLPGADWDGLVRRVLRTRVKPGGADLAR